MTSKDKQHWVIKKEESKRP